MSLRGQLSLNEILFEVEDFIKYVKERMATRKTFAYRDHIDVIVEKKFLGRDQWEMIEHDRETSSCVTGACFEALVRGHVSTGYFLPKISCVPPNDMASFF